MKHRAVLEHEQQVHISHILSRADYKFCSQNQAQQRRLKEHLDAHRAIKIVRFRSRIIFSVKIHDTTVVP